jgi:predicted Zn-dependent peptidase
MSRCATLLLALTVTSPLYAQVIRVAEPDTIPDRPETIAFGPLDFSVPDGDAYRHQLSNGVVVYVAEDHTLPLVSLTATLKIGSYLESDEHVGLAGFTGSLIRSGGTERLAPRDFDEQVEFLAASLSSSGGDTTASAGVRSITPVFEESLALFFDMLRHPRFDPERLEVEKGNTLEAMRQRNDDADAILGREWSWLLYGNDYYGSRRMRKQNLDAITRQDLQAFHARYWRPENMIVSVSGDVDTPTILATLERGLADWPGDGDSNRWPPPESMHVVVPGVYHVEKDIPQGKVLIGHLVPQWTDWSNPDRAALQVMNHILGGSGFTSRIMKRVRSDEGLAYSAGSSFSFDPFQPGTFTVSFQSKNETVALAAKISLEEVRRIQEELVSDEELEIAKGSLIQTFPQRFDSAGQIASTFAYDAFIGRSHEYWQLWRPQVEAVTADDVRRVAQQHLKPDEVVLLLVGKWDEIAKGDSDGRATMADFFGGAVTHLPPRDPLTLEPHAGS